MSLLARYLFRNNLQLLLPTLAIGTGLYILSDLFDRIDDLMDSGVGLQVALWYFIAKLPLIISQILPAVFLLSTLVQLCMMSRARELVALQAGGISFAAILRILMVCGLVWGGVQLGFSQVLGVAGERESSRIWQELVRKRASDTVVLQRVWFTDGAWVVSLESVAPARGTGTGLSAYHLADDGQHMDQVIRAESFTATPGDWTLHNASIFDPTGYVVDKLPEKKLALQQDVATFQIVAPATDPSRLPLWLLGDAIEKLRQAGSNVEALRTAWHMKLSYAASMAVMALVAVALVTWRDNVYLSAGVALVFTFLFYSMFTVGGTVGQMGILPPPVAAWSANILVAVVALWRIILVIAPRRFGR